MSGVLDRLEVLVAEFRACDAASDAGGVMWNGRKIMREARVLLPLLREWLAAEEECAPSTAVPEFASRVRRADYALRAALRTAPAGKAT